MGQGTLTLSNFRFSYAKQAIRYVSPSPSTAATLTVNDSQFVSCIRGIELDNSGSGSAGTGIIAVNLNNSLVSGVQSPIMGGSPQNPISLAWVNCTVDQAIRLVDGNWGSTVSLVSTNSVFANVTNSSTSATLSGAFNGFYSDAQTFGSSPSVVATSPFQSVGGGNYYLTSASGFRGLGSTNISVALRGDLAGRTTFPPTVFSVLLITTNVLMTPQVQRDNVSQTKDLGWHYAPIDYACSGLESNSASLTVTQGVVLATYATNVYTYGIGTAAGSQISCVGTPNNPVRIVGYDTVQEQTGKAWVC